MSLKTKEQVRARVLELVEHYRGMKPLDLIAHLDAEERALFSGAFLEDLITNGDLIEVEFTLPNDPEQIHSFLVPIGTGMSVRYAMETEQPDTVSVH
jgi:hypothetical protein